MNETVWRKCSTCKKAIAFGSKYFLCNVSTCNSKRKGFVFCSVECWDGHVPIMNHRESWSVERVAPSQQAWESQQQQAPVPKKASVEGGSVSDKEILVVVSKIKAYIKTKGDMNTAGDVSEWLSTRLRSLCDDAILAAKQAGRKTVMARDFS